MTWLRSAFVILGHTIIIVLTLLGNGLLFITLTDYVRFCFCYLAGNSGTTLSEVWCNYIDWEFRVDYILAMPIGLALGGMVYYWCFRKLQYRKKLVGLSLVWLAVVLGFAARSLLSAYWEYPY